MRIFEKYLTILVSISILLGLFLGNNFNNIFINIANYSYANINLVIAALIWVMIYPMMLSVDFKCIKKFWDNPRGLYLTIFINWIIKPFSMAGIGILFFHFIFKDFITIEDANSYIAGMILLGPLGKLVDILTPKIVLPIMFLMRGGACFYFYKISNWNKSILSRYS